MGTYCGQAGVLVIFVLFIKIPNHSLLLCVLVQRAPTRRHMAYEQLLRETLSLMDETLYDYKGQDMPRQLELLPHKEQMERKKENFVKFKKEILNDKFDTCEDDEDWGHRYEMWMVHLRTTLGSSNVFPWEIKEYIDIGVMENMLLPSIDHPNPYIAPYSLICLSKCVEVRKGREIMWKLKHEWLNKACVLLRDGLGSEKCWMTITLVGLLDRDGEEGPGGFTPKETEKLIKAMRHVKNYSQKTLMRELFDINYTPGRRHGCELSGHVQHTILDCQATKEGLIAQLPDHIADMHHMATVGLSYLEGREDWLEVQQEMKMKKGLKMCGGCGKEGPTKKCACQEMYYCSVVCQRKDWRQHREVCSARKVK